MLTNLENNNVYKVYEEIACHFNVTRINKWDWIDKFLDNYENKFVLDLGCGNGRNMYYNNIKFLGIDNCDKFVAICKDKGLNVMLSNITDIKLDSNIADGIICIAVFHHLSTEEHRIEALKEMKRLLKPGGKILLSVWALEQPKKTRRTFNHYGNNIVIWNSYGKVYERYYYIFKIPEIVSLFKKCGFLIETHSWNCGNEIFILTKK
jgi:SAM-dependent methyltransferase